MKQNSDLHIEHSASEQQAGHRKKAGVAFAVLAVFSGMGLLGKLPLLRGLLHLPNRVVAAILFLTLAFPMLWRAALKRRLFLAPAVSVLILFALFFGFRSMQQMHRQGRGSDQADCVVVAAHELAGRQWPYQVQKMWTGNAMSCGAGWVALQTPLTVLAGYPVNLAVLWAVSVCVIWWCAGGRVASGLLVLLALSSVFWLALFNGSDFLTFGVLSAAMLAGAEHSRRFGRTKLLWVVAISLVDQFRATTLILPALLRRPFGRVAVLSAFTLELVWQVGFIYWNTAAFTTDGPWHLLRKIHGLGLMPGAGLSSNPLLASMEVVIPLIVAVLVLMQIAERYSTRAMYLVSYAILFGVPALADLAKKYGIEHSALRALGIWEGGLWLCALLPILAYCALVPLPTESRSIP